MMYGHRRRGHVCHIVNKISNKESTYQDDIFRCVYIESRDARGGSD